MNKKAILAVVISLVFVIGSVQITSAHKSYTKEIDGERNLILEQYQYNQTKNLTAKSTLTLPETVRGQSHYRANYTTEHLEGAVWHLSLKIGNNDLQDKALDIKNGSLIYNGSVNLDYPAGDYWANFTMNEGSAYINTTFTLFPMESTSNEIQNMILTFAPILLLAFIIVGIAVGVMRFKGRNTL